ncbi:MAG: NADH-quinone oxidoreductase subunit M [Armatimonadota bacterium]|nr:NADH-quinone oxidoreductase subunit M [Armatimonadota bacterium]
MDSWILTTITFTPLLGTIVLMLIPREKVSAIKWTALLFSLPPLALSIILWFAYDWHKGGMQFTVNAPWIRDIGVYYRMGVDGLSVPMIFLTALLTTLSIIYSWIINERPKEYFWLFLLLATGMFGVFTSLDYFLFYVFWEVGLIPMYFLIGIWGGARREYAAIKFVLYTLVGSVAMLLAILAMYFNVTDPATGRHTFDMMVIAAQKPFAHAHNIQSLIFWALFIGFAIKVPVWPFHTWLPDAHVEAPTAGSVILAGVLLKMGAYGFLRVLLPTLPWASTHYWTAIAILALISIIYGALVAMAQTDLKKLIAYSSVNHMGYVMLGIAAAVSPIAAVNLDNRAVALNGAMLQMFSHGIITGALFLLVGVIYERAHTRNLNEFGGLWARLPLFGSIFITACLASLGLPGMSGFIAELMVFLGTFKASVLFAGLGTIGIVVTAAYLLWTIQRILLGPANPKYEKLLDMDGREILVLTPLVALMLLFGLWPAPILQIINSSSVQIARLFTIGG